MSNNETRVLLADDHLLMRRGFRELIGGMEGWSVCGEVENGREAVAAATALRPHVIVMDVNLPEFNGLEATRQIKRLHPEIEVLLFTGLETEELVRQSFEAGARSYILKTAGTRELDAALRATAEHKSYFTSEVGEILFAKFLRQNDGGEDATGVGRLSAREREIVQLLAEGKANKGVAEALGISVKTAETHRASIMKKMRFQSLSDLVRYAIRNYIITA